MMKNSRRSFLLMLSAFLIFPKTSSAVMDLVSGTDNVYDIGLKNLAPVTAIQRCEQWCWAASLETIYKFWGYDVPQKLIAYSIFGLEANGIPPCRPANNHEILDAFSKVITDKKTGQRFQGRYFIVMQDDGGLTKTDWWQFIYAELIKDRPLIAAYKTSPTTGHAVVITHMRIQVNGPNNYKVLGITVRDPGPESDNKRMLTVEEAKSISFVAAVSVKDV